jgi:hypothetical protein
MSHRTYAPRVNPIRRAAGILLAALVVIAVGTIAVSAKIETWRQEGPTAFAKAHREGVVVSDTGRVRLGHALAPLSSLAADRVWDLARTHDGTVFAATGDAGKIFGRKPGADSPWNIVYDSKDSQALSLVVCPDGTVFAGTGPTGQVVNLTAPLHPASRPDPKVQYIWDMACDSKGNVYAATGPTGQLWRRAPDGKWSLVYDSKASHLLSVAIGPDGSVYAGSDGEGLIYRVSPEGKTSILFDAPQPEIRCLLWGADGALYAGTAAESGGGNTTRSSLFLTQSGAPQILEAPTPGEGGGAPFPGRDDDLGTASYQPPPGGGRGGSARPASPRAPGGGSAAPRPISPGDNAVYRLDSDGVPREVLRVKALIHALAWVDDRLLVGTGPEGQLYEVRDRGHETAPLAKLDSGQILALLVEPDGTVVIGAGDPGAVVRLSPGYATTGRLVSEVHDTKLVSRFGAISWSADRPAGTALAFQARSGNVAEPDETWSSWSAEQGDPLAASIASPAGRFVQYRVKFSTTDPRHTPDLRTVSLSYRTANLAPEIAKIDVPDLSAADGAARQTKLNIRWDTSDPNDDELSYVLKARKEGWPDWISLHEEPITEKTFAWDTTAFPSGSYRLKLFASDRPSNSPDETLTRDRESTVFLVDHDPPSATITPHGSGAEIVLDDKRTRLVKADYALDGGTWTPIFPDDGLFDTLHEKITLRIPGLKQGVHLLVVRVTDSAGNIGSGDALLDVKD